MPPNAFIHIGLAKTGTTSIQNRLASHRQELEDHGFYFPRTGTINQDSGHHCLAWELAGSAKAREFCQGFHPDTFRREIEEQSGGRAVIVSSEELSFLSFNYARVRSLLRLFPSHDIHVVAYVREQAEFFNSYYLEIISDFANPGTIETFVKSLLEEKRYEYKHWFNIWRDLVGEKLWIRPFDRKFLKDGDVVEDFSRTIGLNAPLAGGKNQFRNLALNNLQVAAILELLKRVEATSGTALPPAVRRRLKQIAVAVVSLPEFSAGERYWGIGEASVRTIRERYVMANAEFFRMYGLPNFAFSSISEVPPVTAISFDDLDAPAKDSVERLWTEMVRNALTVPGSALRS